MRTNNALLNKTPNFPKFIVVPDWLLETEVSFICDRPTLDIPLNNSTKFSPNKTIWFNMCIEKTLVLDVLS